MTEISELELVAALPKSRDPRTGDWWADPDVFFDFVYGGNARVGEVVDISTVGVFKTVAAWGETKDETDMGFVIQSQRTGKFYLFTCTYTSWDSQDYDVSEAEEYTFTEQRWRPL